MTTWRGLINSKIIARERRVWRSKKEIHVSDSRKRDVAASLIYHRSCAEGVTTIFVPPRRCRLAAAKPPLAASLLTEQIRIDNNRNRWHAVKQILGEVCHSLDSAALLDSVIFLEYDGHCGNIGIRCVSRLAGCRGWKNICLKTVRFLDLPLFLDILQRMWCKRNVVLGR